MTKKNKVDKQIFFRFVSSAINSTNEMNLTQLKQCLINNPTIINEVMEDGNTALHISLIPTPNKDVAKILLRFGANPDVKNRAGITPFEVINSDRSLKSLIENVASDVIMDQDKKAMRKLWAGSQNHLLSYVGLLDAAASMGLYKISAAMIDLGMQPRTDDLFRCFYNNFLSSPSNIAKLMGEKVEKAYLDLKSNQEASTNSWTRIIWGREAISFEEEEIEDSKQTWAEKEQNRRRCGSPELSLSK